MSLEYNQIKTDLKKIKFDETAGGISSTAKFKKLATLKFCNENGTNKVYHNELSNGLDETGFL